MSTWIGPPSIVVLLELTAIGIINVVSASISQPSVDGWEKAAENIKSRGIRRIRESWYLGSTCIN